MIPLKKFSEILKRDALQNPCQILLVVKSVFNKITGMDSRLAFLLERSFLEGCFPVDTSEFLAFLQSGLTITLVFVKLLAVHCKAALN